MVVYTRNKLINILIPFLIITGFILLVSCGSKPPAKEARTRAVNFVVTDEDGNHLEGVTVDVSFDDGVYDTYTTNGDGQTTVNMTGDLPVVCEISYNKEFLPTTVNVNRDSFSSGQSRIEKKIQMEKKKTIIYGYVYDQANNKPIPGEPVRISTSPIKTPETIYTDKEGLYEIASAEYYEGAELTVEANVSGYNKETTQVMIDTLWGRNKVPTILLESLPKIGSEVTKEDTLIIRSGGVIRTE